MTDSVRKLVEEVLSRDMTREIWSGNYDKVLPFSILDFELPAILPAVFYMFRFGQRRGAGKFLETFGVSEGTLRQRRRSATIERVSERLARADELEGFDGEIERAILGDLLLCFCLENRKHSLGREEQIQRVAPAHYMSSWIDLPQSVGHLRHVPEMITAILADQKGEHVKPSEDGKCTWFSVGKGYEDNVLIRAFSQGVGRYGEVLEDLRSDRFKEEDDSVGLDQLLMIRLAQQLQAAPDRMREKEGHRIPNQRPIAENAARNFSEDIRRFVRTYANTIPRHALTEMLESCVAIGMATILSSTVEILLRWSGTGVIPNRQDQLPAQLFVDCSNGVDRNIRARAEQSMDDFMRRIERFPVVLMVLRLLDYHAKANRRIKRQNISTRPYATDWINLLGDILHDRHEETQRIFYVIGHNAEQLADKLEEEYPETASILSDVSIQQNPAWRLASGLMTLMGSGFVHGKLINMFDSILLNGRPNGLVAKRATTRGGGGATRRKRDVRSLLFTDSVLEYLVHLHLLPSGSRPGVRDDLSFKEFIDSLRSRYGFHVDAAPQGMTISNTLLQRNRTVLERRLRDLGLLVGVNDAEKMKRLQPRFEPEMES